MNLRPPPNSADVEELRSWCKEVYEFLKYPSFHVIRFLPQSDSPNTAEGNVYYDSDDDKLKVRDASTWQDTY